MNDSKTIEQIIKDMEKLQERYRKKAEKEREKRRKPYITVQGQKVYSQEELFDFWESGYITSSARFDQYRDKLQAALKPVEEQTPSEAMLENDTEALRDEIYYYIQECKEEFEE